ncbi:hypothetical protein IRJ41_008978 [Triplophysa rosa]|uniref:Uncharacterized protein n=1 Tax=Triplophysa rosa TaxID=992332 RepID=A0A9W7W9A0_TRIRA|nr:hypothetical protein IRJ41_008978 [Triplophysa rosa]
MGLCLDSGGILVLEVTVPNFGTVEVPRRESGVVEVLNCDSGVVEVLGRDSGAVEVPGHDSGGSMMGLRFDSDAAVTVPNVGFDAVKPFLWNTDSVLGWDCDSEVVVDFAHDFSNVEAPVFSAIEEGLGRGFGGVGARPVALMLRTEYPDVLSAAQSLISVLTQTLNQSPVTPRPQVQVQGQGQQTAVQERQTNTTIDQDMARAFPSMFRRHAIRGKKRINVASRTHTKTAKAFKPYDLNVYLLDTNSETTPSPAHELKLVQAGLGKRTISIAMDMMHSEFSSTLYEAFPKMECLSGGWMLYKANGGCGTRRINVIPPDSEGYTGSQMKSASASGKTMLYVVPLQEELDLNPLPNDAREFTKMPKATCQICNKSMPLQVLALHIQVCKSNDSTSSDEETEVQFVSENNLDEMKQENFTSELKFPVDSLELHASLCGEENLLKSPDHSSFMHNDDSCIADDTTGNSSCRQVLCLEDLLELLAGRVNAENHFRICVSRDNLLERGIKQWQRQKKGNPAKDNLYWTAGEIFAVSLAQCGPAPCFMREWCYSYLTTGEVDVTRICKDDVDDVEYSLLIAKVEEATDLTEFTDEIISCGYTGALNIEQKDAIIR